MSTDYLPNRDSDFVTWLNAFTAYATTNMAALGLVAADTSALTAASTAFGAALATHNTAQKSALGARQAKDTARTAAEKVLRRYAKDLQNRPTVTDAQRAALGLNVRDAKMTPALMAVAAAPSRPLGIIDNTRQLIHRLRFVEESQPSRRAKPEGVKGCEVWSCVLAAGSPAPADESGMKYIDTPSAGPLEMTFAAADAGKTAWYRLRWVSNSGEKGEWSRPVGAMILG